MRKLLALILALLMLASMLISCGNTEDLNNGSQSLLDSGFQGSFGSGSGTNIQSMKPTDKYGQEKFTSAVPKLDFDDDSTESSFDKKTGGNTENGDNSKSLQYLVNIDGTTCTITGGSGDNLSIPSKIDGFTVTAIGKSAFEGNRSIKSVTIPDSVKSIGEWAFGYCSSLTSITLGSGITSIGFCAFENCYKLVEVINKSSRTITAGSDSNGFIAKYALEVHNGESKIKKVNDYIFYTTGGVNYLCGYVGTSKELVLPDKYNNQNYKIYKYAFYNSKITSIVISSGVVGIGANAFSGCSSLTSAEFKITSGWSVGGTAAGANVISNKSTVATYLKDTYKDKEWTRS